MKEILDTRFFLELFNATDAERLASCRAKWNSVRRAGNGAVPTVVVSEVVREVCESRGREAAEERYLSLLHSGIALVPLDPELAGSAGLLRCGQRRVPLADCIVAAVALREGGKVISDDPHFRSLGVRLGWV